MDSDDVYAQADMVIYDHSDLKIQGNSLLAKVAMSMLLCYRT